MRNIIEALALAVGTSSRWVDMTNTWFILLIKNVFVYKKKRCRSPIDHQMYVAKE